MDPAKNPIVQKNVISEIRRQIIVLPMSPVFQNRSKIVPRAKSRIGEKMIDFPENALCLGQT